LKPTRSRSVRRLPAFKGGKEAAKCNELF
jgi:hypothetical protein